MRLKPVMTYDPRLHKIRLFRFLWTHGRVGDGNGGYSAKLSLSLRPRLIGFERQYFGWYFWLLGLEVHHLKAYGGIIP